LQFRFDSQLPAGGSHHQKFVVIDGHIAFVGGLDFNGDDWDDRDHLPKNPLRRDSGKEPHDPYHDIQAGIIGAAAEELTRYFQMRWLAAGYQALDLAPGATPAPMDLGIPIHSTRVAFSLNQPATEALPRQVTEIQALYTDAIAAAQKHIYIENQYFTADVVGEALARRMRDAKATPLDVVLILPKQLPSWLESATLEPLRLRLLVSLENVARETGHRLGVYYSAAADETGREVATLIHSKLLIIDDRFMSVGSANTSNRSMHLDAELNVTWEATSAGETDLLRSIRDARVSLLAEHCGFRDTTEFTHRLAQGVGLVDFLDAIATAGQYRLRPLTREAILQDQEWLARLEQWGFSFDPKAPLTTLL